MFPKNYSEIAEQFDRELAIEFQKELRRLELRLSLTNVPPERYTRSALLQLTGKDYRDVVPLALKGFTVPYGYVLRISSPVTGEEFIKEEGEQSGGQYSLDEILSGANPDWVLEQINYQQGHYPEQQQQQQQPEAQQLASGPQKLPLEQTQPSHLIEDTDEQTTLDRLNHEAQEVIRNRIISGDFSDVPEDSVLGMYLKGMNAKGRKKLLYQLVDNIDVYMKKSKEELASEFKFTRGPEGYITPERQAELVEHFFTELTKITTNLPEKVMDALQFGQSITGEINQAINEALTVYDYEDRGLYRWPVHQHFGTFENALDYIVKEVAASVGYELISNPVEDELPDEQIPTINLDETPLTKELLDQYKHPKNARRLFAKMTSNDLVLAAQAAAEYDATYKDLVENHALEIKQARHSYSFMASTEYAHKRQRLGTLSTAENYHAEKASSTFIDLIVDPNTESLIRYKEGAELKLSKQQLTGACFALSFFNCSHSVTAHIDPLITRASGTQGLINLNPNDPPYIAAHEIGHTLPGLGDVGTSLDNNLLYAMSFLHTRVGRDETPQLMSDLRPLSKYNADEISFKDRFHEPYSGKVYGDVRLNRRFNSLDFAHVRDTEVVTMGIQCMCENPFKFAQIDPDYFEMIWSMRTQNRHLAVKKEEEGTVQ